MLPTLSHAQAPLTYAVQAQNETGAWQTQSIPCERALTVYVDKRELVTLMTLGARPELLVLGYLINQRLVQSAADIESITVDWEVGAAAVKTRSGITDIESKTAHKVVTTGCGQGSVFGQVMESVGAIALPPTTLTQSQLYSIVNTIRLQQSIYKTAGSVHGCALFAGDTLRMFVEDVGRHNAIDTIAGWMAMQSDLDAPLGDNHIFYTTGRLTSEMVIKAAQMGIAVVISRSGITQMGHAVATQLDLCTVGRATHTRYLCFSGQWRLQRSDVPSPQAVV